MKDNTNKAWYVFAFSVLFLIVAFSFLNRSFIGAANTDTGTLNFTINSSLSIQLLDANVSFGVGAINETGAEYATVNTNTSVENGTWPGNYDIMVLENDGNVNVNITIWATNDAETFIGGSGADFLVNAENNLTSSCYSGLISAYTTIPTVSPGLVLCDYLNYSSGANRINLHYKLVVPRAATPGDKTNTITVEGSVPS